MEQHRRYKYYVRVSAIITLIILFQIFIMDESFKKYPGGPSIASPSHLIYFYHHVAARASLCAYLDVAGAIISGGDNNSDTID